MFAYQGAIAFQIWTGIMPDTSRMKQIVLKQLRRLNMLTGKQKRFLRSKAHHLNPIFQVGKGGVNENIIKQIGEALEARELLKVSVLQNCEEDRNDVASMLIKGARAELVQIIGNTIVLYKESRENKQLQLP